MSGTNRFKRNRGKTIFVPHLQMIFSCPQFARTCFFHDSAEDEDGLEKENPGKSIKKGNFSFAFLEIWDIFYHRQLRMETGRFHAV